MANIATNGTVLFKSSIEGNTVKVGNLVTDAAVGPLLGDVIAVNGQTIGVVARIGSGSYADKGYCCTLNPKTPWKELGPTAQQQSITWDGNKFLCARIGRYAEGSPLIVQTLDGTIITTTATGGTSEGILYYDEIDRKFIIADTKAHICGKYTLYKPVRRRKSTGEIFWTGQKVGTPDILFTTNGGSIGFKSGLQPKYPQFVIIGETLIVNGGIEFKPPYPTTVPPVEPPIPPKPEPPVAIPNHKDVVERMRVKYNGMPAGAERGYTITNAVAWELKDEGAGTFFKDSGTNYNDRSIDIVIYKHQVGDPAGKGKTFDILGDAEGKATPQWSRTSPTGLGDERLWRAPVEPAGGTPIPPTPTNPDRDMLIHIRDEINEFLGEN